MKMNLTKLKWYNKGNVWVTGFIRNGNSYLIKDELCAFFSANDSPSDFERTLKEANGQFSVIIKKDGEIWAATDRLRNYPLFYTVNNSDFIIGDDCYKLAEESGEKSFNLVAVYSFLASGYVINNLTLINNIFQIEAGEYLIAGESLARKFYYDISAAPVVEKDFETRAEELKNMFPGIFSDHFQAMKDKFIVIPLSGGYDSRLIAAMCSKFHPQNVLCYTYGTEDNLEVAPAKEVARRLGFKWINIIYDSALIDKYLTDGFFEGYYPYAANLSSMFYMQEYFAVKYLKEHKLIPDNSVFVNGFSGDMLAGSYLTPAMKNKMKKAEIAKLILKLNFGLISLSNQKKSDILKLIQAKIPNGISDCWKVYENWKYKDWQAKYIVNSAKVFTYFGYEYVMPLYDNVLMDFFSGLQFSYKLDKKLYDYVLTKYIFNEFDLNLKNEINTLSSTKAFQRVKEKIKPLFPKKIRNLLVDHKSPVFYDEITKILIQDMGQENIISPKQSNFYTSYITQWYLFNTRKNLKTGGNE
jgi:asparagine synthase (glutamine-hydrolysing)